MTTTQPTILITGLTSPEELMRILGENTMEFSVLHPLIYSPHKLLDFPTVNTQVHLLKQSNILVETFIVETTTVANTVIIKEKNSETH